MNIIKYLLRPITSFSDKQRMLILQACSIVLIFTMFCYLAYSFFSINQESRDRLSALGDIIGADVAAKMTFGGNRAVTESLAVLKADSSIKQVFVLNEQDQVIAYYNQNTDLAPNELQQSLKSLRSKIRQQFIDLSPGMESPVIRNGIRLGTILIEQNDHIIIKKISDTTGISAFILLFALGLSYLLAGRFQRIVTEPVTVMATIMRDVSYTKDYSKRVPSFNTDEIDLLAKCFNEMLSEIEQRDEDLLDRQKQLHHMANFDSLTGLPNRVLFNDRLEQALRHAARTGEKLAVLFIDLDDFKMVNDAYGHRTGDQLLLETTTRLAAITRTGDTLARLGGDEFTIILQDVKTAENALSVARKHIKNLFLHYLIDNRQLFVSASIGVAIYPEHGTTMEALVKNADAAMYQAKEKGKNSVELFSDSINSKLSEKLLLSNDLYRALEQGEFELHYQPRINLRRNSWASAEALLRWNHPKLGRVPPDKFIPLAEKNGMILPIGEWVLREACRQLHQWHCQGFHLPRISVNVSPLQLQRQDLIGIIKDALSSNNLCAQSLELEIVESALVEDSGRSVSLLKELQNIGVKISIDDFGTGYSSLSYLRTLPIDILKIDRSFMINAHESEEDRRIIAAICAMALSLGLEVVTEGVENVEQEQILKDHYCNEAQGYYYDRPMSAEELSQRFMTSQILLEEFDCKLPPAANLPDECL
jgi:diguanylate cyclase (GGDEF)-like protein